MALMPVAEALARVLADTAPLPTEDVSLDDALGRVLATDLSALRTQPPDAVSAMDGYAVRGAEVAQVPVTLTVIGEVAAGHPFDGTVGAGQAARIFTGGVMPAGADTVVIQEHTARDGDKVTVQKPTASGRNVRGAGIDFKQGDTLLAKGRRLSDRDLMLAAAMNYPRLAVYRRPHVAVLGLAAPFLLLLQRRRVLLGAWIILAGGIYLVGLSYSVVPFFRYVLPVSLLLNVLAALAVVWLARLAIGRPMLRGLILGGGIAVIAYAQLERCLDYDDQFANDSRDALQQWVKANIPADSLIAADNFTFLGYREYEVADAEGDRVLRAIDASGLGILRANERSMAPRSLRTLAANVGPRRLIVVGGAGSLFVAPGLRLLDTPDFPPGALHEAKAQLAALRQFAKGGGFVDWVYVSPAPDFGPGTRTGAYRVGSDTVMGGWISFADYAVAILDEIEKPAHRREQFCVSG